MNRCKHNINIMRKLSFICAQAYRCMYNKLEYSTGNSLHYGQLYSSCCIALWEYWLKTTVTENESYSAAKLRVDRCKASATKEKEQQLCVHHHLLCAQITTSIESSTLINYKWIESTFLHWPHIQSKCGGNDSQSIKVWR